MNIKFAATLSLALGAALLAGCEKKPESAVDSAVEAVGDATDTRDNESMKDAAEDLQDAASNAGDAIGEAAADAGDAMTDAAADAGEAMSDAASSAGDAMSDAAADMKSAVTGE